MISFTLADGRYKLAFLSSSICIVNNIFPLTMLLWTSSIAVLISFTCGSVLSTFFLIRSFEARGFLGFAFLSSFDSSLDSSIFEGSFFWLICCCLTCPVDFDFLIGPRAPLLFGVESSLSILYLFLLVGLNLSCSALVEWAVLSVPLVGDSFDPGNRDVWDVWGESVIFLPLLWGEISLFGDMGRGFGEVDSSDLLLLSLIGNAGIWKARGGGGTGFW